MPDEIKVGTEVTFTDADGEDVIGKITAIDISHASVKNTIH